MNTRYSLIDCHEYAKKRGGTCLSLVYVSSKMTWKCSLEHIWEARFNHIKAGTWCPKCDKEKRKLKGYNRMSLDTIKTRLHKLGFTFLSTTYTGSDNKYILKCEKNHIFNDKRLRHILDNKTGCPECNNSFRSERLFRESIERIFKKSFPKSRPSWLTNPNTKRKLELDCYNEELGIAFEYDGQFHYEVRIGIGNDLEKTRQLDLLKEKLCKENNVHLIRVPYFLKDKKFYEKILEGLKFMYKENYWYIIREMDSGVPCPQEIKDLRAAARLLI